MRTFSVYTEYRQLKEAIVCSPANYYQTAPINDVEAHYLLEDPPVREQLIAEHKVFTDTLESLGVSLHFLEAAAGVPHQVFTRDVGFAVGENFFLANLAKDIRKPEVEILQKTLLREQVDFKKISTGLIEGGDVVVHKPYVFVGLSQRTDLQGIAELTRMLGSKWKVITFALASNVLHLDCTLAVLNSDTIIWCPELILDQHELIEKVFSKRIRISDEQAFHMAANVLMVNPYKVIVEKRHVNLQAELEKIGLQTYPIDWTETKKLGGLFRCATCPLA